MSARIITAILILFALPAKAKDRFAILTFDSAKSAKKMYFSSRKHPVISTFGRYVVVNVSAMKDSKAIAKRHPGFLEFRISEVLQLAGEIVKSESSLESLGGSRKFRCEVVDNHFKNFSIVWDAQLSNCDLMQAEIKSVGLDPRKVSIALVDTGVDANLSKIVPLQISTNGKEEPADHGTQVASQVARCSPDSAVSSYGVFKKNENTFTANEHDVAKAVEKACDDGNLVINLSASLSGIPLQHRFKYLNRDLAEKGCILVEASGNDAKNTNFINEKYRNREIIAVGACDVDGTMWKKATPAELCAAGVNVPAYGLNGERAVPSGTSFAAPRVSAIVKSVYGALLESEEFRQLPNPRKVKMIGRIIRESAREGAVDGYRALKLARGAAKYLKDFEGREAQFMQSHFSEVREQAPEKMCLIRETCEEMRSCYQQLRRSLSLASSKPTADQLKDLKNTARFSDDFGLSSIWSRLEMAEK